MKSEEIQIERLLPARGRLFVVSGPSGVGKDAVLARLLADPTCPAGVERCVTATTRPPRAGEIEGRDYYFLLEDEFQTRIARGHFLEHAVYNRHHYGTPAESVEARRAAGIDVILKIEIQGARQVATAVPDAILIFLAPPSWTELERRLRGRHTESEAEAQRRLAVARQELGAAPAYDYLIVNDAIDRASSAIRAIIVAERCRIRAVDGCKQMMAGRRSD